MDFGLSLSPGEQSESLKIVLPTGRGKRGSGCLKAITADALCKLHFKNV